MARKLRVWFPGAVYHIMCRGNHRHKIFRDDEDCQVYLYTLRQVMEFHPFQLLSYCLMSNHVHLQMATIDVPPGMIMKRINMKYAIYFNKKYSFVGHLMQGRFRSEIIDNDSYMLEISRYIHLNPVKAKMVGLPEEYQWSSYPDYISPHPAAIADTEKILGFFSEPRRERYQKYVKQVLKHFTSGEKVFVNVPENLLLEDPNEVEGQDEPVSS